MAGPVRLGFLTPERGLIFRITHIDNVPWILDHGLHCRDSNIIDPSFREIGNPDLIGKRAARRVPVPPGGTLGDYVPFYFTPRTPMQLNIVTGYNGMHLTPRHEIVHVVVSLPRLVELKVSFVVTDRHAILAAAQFSSGLAGLDELDWGRFQTCNFKKDPDDPERFERYQAEALIHRHVPIGAIEGIVCYRAAEEATLTAEMDRRGIVLRPRAKPEWYC